jgi:hypothetical protein
VEQELLTILEYPSSPPVLSVICVVFYESLFVISAFFFWPLDCLLYRPFSFGHWIVCYIGLFLLAIGLFVIPAFFFWPLDCLLYGLFLLAIGLFVPRRVMASDYHLIIFKHFLESDCDNQNVVIEYKLCL